MGRRIGVGVTWAWAWLISAVALGAQGWELDPVYRPQITTTNNSGLTAAVLQPDGKLLVAGSFDVFHGRARSGVARLEATGELDETFAFSGGVLGKVNTMSIQADGKVLVGGAFQVGPAPAQRNLLRLSPSGAIDPAFRPAIDGRTECQVRVIRLLADGRIAIGGDFDRVGDASRRGVAVLHADGSLDKTFDPGAGVEDPFGWVEDLLPTAAGGLLVAGGFAKFDGRARSGLVELDAAGAVSETFVPHLDWQFGWPKVTAIRRQEDGLLLIAGQFDGVNEQSRITMARLTPDGALDEDFKVGGDFLGPDLSPVRDFVLLPEGRILVAGDFLGIGDVPRPGLMRLDRDGSIDPGFDLPEGLIWADGSAGWASVVAVQPGGDGIVVLGGFDRIGGVSRHLLGRVSADGVADTSFSKEGRLVERSGKVNAIAGLADGSVYAGGDFERVNGIDRHGLARIDALGGLDATFDAGLAPGSVVNALAVQPDGKLLVGGRFSEVHGEIHVNLLRFDETGAADPTFVENNPGGDVTCLALGPDGQIAIGGPFDVAGGLARSRIAVLDAGGTVDPGFAPDLSHVRDAPEVDCLLYQSNGLLVVGGHFDHVNGDPRANMARLRTDGSIDPAFDPDLRFDGDLSRVLALVADPVGRILVGGTFEWVNGQARPGIARLESDGPLDAAFSPAVEEDGEAFPSVYAVADIDTGEVFVGGGFDALGGLSCRNLACLDSTGHPRLLAWGGGGTDGWVLAVVVQAGPAVMVGGAFTTVAGSPRQAIARLVPPAPPGPEIRVWTAQGKVWIQWDGVGRLQSSANMTGPWRDEPGLSAPVEIDPQDPARFYRVIE
jgi:uncharacterized delta-60 repeat protein